MLNRVKIQNFKSIGEPGVDLELKPLTFLVGPNGGGKSSILEAIAFASQKGSRKANWEESFTFHELKDIHFRQVSNELIIQIEALSSKYMLSHLGSGNQFSEINHKYCPTPSGETYVSKALFDKVFLIRATRGTISADPSSRDSIFDNLTLIWVGQVGQNILEVLDRLRNARFRTRREKIEKWSSKFGMPYVAASSGTSASVEGSYEDDQLKTALNLYLASSGNRQVLPVIVQLFWSEPESIIMIEEPEISLHPKAQIDVLEMFAEAINEEDKQIIATTHGLFLIQAIGYAVQKGWLKADQVAVHHIEKKKDVGTVSKQLEVKETGYIKGWIPSFTRVERQLLNEWAKTLPEA